MRMLYWSINFTETTKHKIFVLWYMLKACYAIIIRAIKHDNSKYSGYEAPYFEYALPLLRNSEYGSDEYKRILAGIEPALDHHYKNNPHHPEYYHFGVEDMTPLDLIEMLCDWKAATRRHATGSFGRSLEINEKRFGYSENVTFIFKNTAREIGLWSWRDDFHLKLKNRIK